MPDVVQHEALPVHGEAEAARPALHEGLRVTGDEAEDPPVEGLSDPVGAPLPARSVLQVGSQVRQEVNISTVHYDSI